MQSAVKRRGMGSMVLEAVKVGVLRYRYGPESSCLEKRLVAIKYTGRDARTTSDIFMQI